MSAGKLPVDWKTVELGELIKLSTGKLDANAADNDGQYPFFTCAESVSQINSWAFDTSAVLLAGNGSFSIKKYTGKFNAYQRTYVIEPILIKTEFLYWLLRGNIKKITENGRGSTIPYIRKGDITDISVALPSPSEQTLIAEKLDTLLAQVESTKARLEQIPQILKRFRQAVLTFAMNGELTKEWRSQNNNPAFFPAEKNSLKQFRNKELPSIPNNWSWMRFDQVADIASKDGVTSAKHEFYTGQIIYSKIRPYLCKVTIATFDGMCSADMYPINSKIDTHFLFRWMLTNTFTDWASNAESRTVLPKINQKDLSEIPVPTPPLPEQHEIVRRVEQLFAYADTIEKQVNNALARVNNLTQSILAKAFRGELTAQWRAENPDLISGENSAAALLEKIKAERAASGGKKASRKKS